MRRSDGEPAWQTALKAVAAVLLVIVALGFGAVGACGVYFSGAGLWQTLIRRSGGGEPGYMMIAVLCAAVGLGLAVLLGWAAVTMFRKKGARDE